MTATLSRLDSLRRNRFIGELERQLDTNPKFRELPAEFRAKVRNAIADDPFRGCDVASCRTPADLAHAAAKRIDAAIRAGRENEDVKAQTLEVRKHVETATADREPTGLRNLKTVFKGKETSIEDRIKRGFLGAGMRVNRSNTNPVILDSLKTNGVEPGFIYRNDWSKDDTHGFMALRDQGLDQQAEILVANAVLDGGGIKTLFDNLAFLFEQMMPEDAEKRAALTDILDDMMGDFEGGLLGKGGDYINRIGNEIMVDAEDLR